MSASQWYPTIYPDLQFNITISITEEFANDCPRFFNRLYAEQWW